MSSHNGLGKTAIVQFDSRFCGATGPFASDNTITTSTTTSTTTKACGRPQINGSTAFWWLTAAINAAWARQHGYDALLYCLGSRCAHPDSGEKRSPQFCKIIVLAHALLDGNYEHLFYLDSDAYWKDPSLDLSSGLIERFAPELSLSWPGHGPRNTASSSASPVSAQPTLFFGCNSPWDYCGVRWNFSAPFAASGSANTGVILLRKSHQTTAVLTTWWHARNGWARPQHIRRAGSCSDQAVLWRLWNARHDLASSSMRVLGRLRNASELAWAPSWRRRR